MARITQTFRSNERFSNHEADAYSDDDGKTWRWCSNDQYVPLDACLSHSVPCDMEAQRAARDAQFAEFARQYKAQQPAVPSPERQAEMRAAFGPGVEVVDVISGRKFTT